MNFVSLAVVGRRDSKFPGWRCLPPNLGENFTYLQSRCRPGIKVPSRKEDKRMFQGTTIDELMSSVQRAEEHAREQKQATERDRLQQLRRFEWRREMIEVA